MLSLYAVALVCRSAWRCVRRAAAASMLVPVMHVRIAGGRLLQRLVEQLVARAAAKAVPFVEEARTVIIEPELQLQSDQTSPRQISFDRRHEKRAYSP